MTILFNSEIVNIYFYKTNSNCLKSFDVSVEIRDSSFFPSILFKLDEKSGEK